MEEKYTYEIVNDGYYILNEGKRWIHQYEPYIPDSSKSYEENAKLQIQEIVVNDYAMEIINGKKTIEDVPQDLKEAVQKTVEVYEKAKQNEPATIKDYNNLQNSITDIELALVEIYEKGVQK